MRNRSGMKKKEGCNPYQRQQNRTYVTRSFHTYHTGKNNANRWHSCFYPAKGEIWGKIFFNTRFLRPVRECGSLF
jgi:hypothetical protein